MTSPAAWVHPSSHHKSTTLRTQKVDLIGMEQLVSNFLKFMLRWWGLNSGDQTHPTKAGNLLLSHMPVTLRRITPGSVLRKLLAVPEIQIILLLWPINFGYHVFICMKRNYIPQEWRHNAYHSWDNMKIYGNQVAFTRCPMICYFAAEK